MIRKKHEIYTRVVFGDRLKALLYSLHKLYPIFNENGLNDNPLNTAGIMWQVNLNKGLEKKRDS